LCFSWGFGIGRLDGGGESGHTNHCFVLSY